MQTKKELKASYQQMVIPKGVFQIRNTVNGKIWVESSMNLTAIWNRYRLQLEVGSHPSPALQQDWRSLGPDAFVFEVLAELEQDGIKTDQDYRKELKVLEAMFLDELQPYGKKGYNREPVLRT